MYAILGFDMHGWFESEKTRLSYRGVTYDIVRRSLNFSEKAQPASNQLIIHLQNHDEKKAVEDGIRFLCEVSWLYDVPILDINITVSSIPIRTETQFSGHRVSGVVVDLDYYRDFGYTDEQLYSIGMYRDGVSLLNKYYGFLSLWKILEYNLENKKRIAYLQNYFVHNHEFVETLFHLSPDEKQKYLYDNVRCAIAHSSYTPRMDMFSLDDYRRVSSCYNILKKIVREYMAKDLNIGVIPLPSSLVLS